MFNKIKYISTFFLKFLLNVKTIIKSREVELKFTSYKDTNYNNMWEFVESNNNRISEKSDLSIM